MAMKIVRDSNQTVSLDSTSAEMGDYLSPDGLLNIKAVEALEKRVSAAVAKIENPTITVLYYSPKPIGPYSASLEKKGDHKYLLSRTPLIRSRKVPKNFKYNQAHHVVGKGHVWLVDIQGLPVSIDLEVTAFINAVNKHNARVQKVKDLVQKEKKKISTVVNKKFEDALDKVANLFGAGAEIVTSASPFGRSVIVKLDADTFISVGPSTVEKFKAAQKAAKEV
jgi:hypothetical protein